MTLRGIVRCWILLSSAALASGAGMPVLAQESDQQINDFSLAGYGEKGKKNWDLSGKSANILTEVVQLNDVIGNLYSQEEDVRLTAERGDFNKTNGRVHLEENVVIATSSGAKLTTDSLDWDRKNQLVSTRDAVNMQRDNLSVVASGAKGMPTLKKVSLDKDVRLNIDPPAHAEPTDELGREQMVITCDGPVEIDYEKNVAVFHNNVKVERSDTVITGSRMDVYFLPASGASAPASKMPAMGGNRIDRIVAKGDVMIARGGNVSTSEEAIYTASDKKITLSGRPKLVIHSAKDFENASIGN